MSAGTVPLTSIPCFFVAGDELDGLLLDLRRVLAFNEELLDVAAGVNEDVPRREWTADGVRRIGALGRNLLLFAADKASVLACHASRFVLSLSYMAYWTCPATRGLGRSTAPATATAPHLLSIDASLPLGR